MSGKFIVVEGLDCSGKTTLINKLLKEFPNSIYCKGIGSSDTIGKIARLFHSTLSFSIELLYRTYFEINPNLKKSKIVFQDRYFVSVASYLPSTRRLYNKIILKTLSNFIKNPDVFIYLTLPLEERRKRLVQKGTYYELYLAKNPQLIILREKFYESYLNSLICPKIKIDTHKNTLKKCVNLAISLLFQY